MNEFSAKKLGEVLAFAVVGIETFQKGRKGFENILGETELKKLITKFGYHREVILAIADNNGIKEIVLQKLESTGNKLRSMRDMYMGDAWDNPTELLEWSGFFEGAAIVHWALVDGTGVVTEDADLMDVSEDAIFVHKEFLEKIEVYLNEVGQEKGV